MQNNNIRKVAVITFCTHFHFYIHVYALLLLSRGLSLVQVSGIESAVIGFVFLLEIPTGVLADRIGRKWSVAGSLFCLMCAEFLFVFVRSYWAYIIVAFLTGSGFAFASGATESLVYDSLPQSNREESMKSAMSRIGSVKQVAVFLSPLIGGVVRGGPRRQTRIRRGNRRIGRIWRIRALIVCKHSPCTLHKSRAMRQRGRDSVGYRRYLLGRELGR